ncbi:MAG: hypothetical protein B6U94_03710 [Thermofilum sp. ex4484_79]|nr:MAG: hypothetical protein B6U94_03710 [Thermofilum sp. ex4484_79]
MRRYMYKVFYLAMSIIISLSVGWLINIPYQEKIFNIVVNMPLLFMLNLWTYYTLLLLTIVLLFLGYMLYIAFKERLVNKRSLMAVLCSFILLAAVTYCIFNLVYSSYSGKVSLATNRNSSGGSTSLAPMVSVKESQNIKLNRTPTRVLSSGSSLNVFPIAFLAVLLIFTITLAFLIRYTGYVSSDIKDEHKVGFIDKKGVEIMEKRKREAINLLEISINNILNCQDYRKAIILTYLRMCKMLRDHNIDVPESITAREFEEKVHLLLPLIPHEPLHELTLLFEESKYSDHPMDSMCKNKALKLLSAIRDSLVKEDGEGN